MIVVLTGGLGNQLFQTAAALKLVNYESKNLFFDSITGKPRVNKTGVAEVYEYITFKPEEYIPSKSRFFRKIYRLNLLLSARKSTYPGLIIKKLLAYMSSLAMSFHAKKLLLLLVSNGIGYDKKYDFIFLKTTRLLIGYFQSYIYFDRFMLIPKLLMPSKSALLKITELVENLRVSKKVLIHVRRGDYVNEPDFGLLGLDYYSEAISYFEDLGFKEFLVFSDDINVAKDMLDSLTGLHIEYFSERELGSSHVLEVMTYAAGFIIANSTFSWWAAYMRKNISANVCAPSKWFLRQQDPYCLIPNDWLRI